MRRPEPVTHTVTQATIDAYADLSGDHNPLHVDAAYAAASEFGSTIAHGPVGLQAFFALLAGWLGSEAPTPGTHVEVVYRGPVRPGETVTCEAEARPGDGAIELEAICRAGEQTVVTITASVPAV